MRNRLVQLRTTTRLTDPFDELVDDPVDESLDELVDEVVGEVVDLHEEEQPEQDLHAAEVMLRRVHANLGHPKGLMLRS